MVETKTTNNESITATVEDLELSYITLGRLKHAGIDTVGDLINMTWDEFIRIRNLGKKSGDEVLLKLERLGFSLKFSEEQS